MRRLIPVALLLSTIPAVFAFSATKRHPRVHPHPKKVPAPAPAQPAAPAVPATLLFSQEFNSYETAVVPGTNVLTSWPLGSDANSKATVGEVEIYCDVQMGKLWGGPNPFKVADGILTITAQPVTGLPAGLTYTSGMICTAGKFSFQTGYVEASIRVPGGTGFWPALWMMQDTGPGGAVVWPPEVDIVQCSSRIPNESYVATYSKSSTGSVNEQGGFVTLPGPADGFHVHGFEWTTTTLNWYCDGKLLRTQPTPSGFNVPMFLMFNLAVGDDGDWIRKPDGSTQSLSIDYLRVWDHKP